MDPKRFLDGDDAAFETQLVRAGRRETAPDGAAQRAAVALGLAAGSAAVTSGAGAAGLGTAGGVAGFAKVSLVGIGKWFGIGILSGLVVTTGFHVVTRLGAAPGAAESTTGAGLDAVRPPRPAPPPSSPANQASPPAEAPAVASDEAAQKAEAAREPAAAARPAPHSKSAPKKETEAEPRAEASAAPEETEPRPASLSAELALLQEARRALVAHEPARVLAVLQRYSGSPRSGLLDSEADVLRVEALVQAGRRPEAAALAASALAAAPEGPHAARFRQIVEATHPAEP